MKLKATASFKTLEKAINHPDLKMLDEEKFKSQVEQFLDDYINNPSNKFGDKFVEWYDYNLKRDRDLIELKNLEE